MFNDGASPLETGLASQAEARTMRKPKAGALGKRDWVLAARKVLIRKGISNVKVEPLAKALGVTSGSFYWHFSRRQDLYDALLKDWYDTNTTPLFNAVGTAGSDPRQQYLAFFGVWVLERDFDPRYDQAIRDWARGSRKVADTLRKVDASRIELLRRIYLNFGYRGLDAEMRARVTYYHQLGYYAMHIKEPRKRRLSLGPYYADILTGHRWMHRLGSVDSSEAWTGKAVFADEWRPDDVASLDQDPVE
jgi:AcrR family transcriptional regulator